MRHTCFPGDHFLAIKNPCSWLLIPTDTIFCCSAFGSICKNQASSRLESQRITLEISDSISNAVAIMKARVVSTQRSLCPHSPSFFFFNLASLWIEFFKIGQRDDILEMRLCTRPLKRLPLLARSEYLVIQPSRQWLPNS